MKPLVLILGSMLFLSCASPQPEPATNTAEVQQAIEAVNAQVADALGRGDGAAFASFYTENAMFMAPNAEAVRGRQAIQDGMGQDETKLTDLKLTTSEVEVHGDTAIEVGSYSINITPPGQEESIPDKGKYVVIWKKQADGSWKLHRDIFNSNLPLAPPGSAGEEQQ